jgi:hypothetical protein
MTFGPQTRCRPGGQSTLRPSQAAGWIGVYGPADGTGAAGATALACQAAAPPSATVAMIAAAMMSLRTDQPSL